MTRSGPGHTAAVFPEPRAPLWDRTDRRGTLACDGLRRIGKPILSRIKSRKQPAVSGDWRRAWTPETLRSVGCAGCFVQGSRARSRPRNSTTEHNRSPSPIWLSMRKTEAPTWPGIRCKSPAAQSGFDIKTFSELGEICGATASVVGNWMSGGNQPRIPGMARLCGPAGSA